MCDLLRNIIKCFFNCCRAEFARKRGLSREKLSSVEGVLHPNCPTPKAECKANSGDTNTIFVIMVISLAGKYALSTPLIR